MPSVNWASTEHPQEIGGYQVIQLLGHGGMGSVYLVEGKEGKRALKLLRVAATLRQLDRLRFEREFRIISQLDHPSLVRVYELGESLDRPFFTMTYVDGENLRSHVNFTGGEAISWPERLRRVRDSFEALLSGLEYIHQHQVVHRDLKPENVMVDQQGNTHLLDFGLARGSTGWADSAEKRLTEPGMVLGTVHYMSPEQITGGELDSRSDLYSLGVMLYEALCGKLPFDGPEPMTVLFQIINQPPPLLQTGGPLHPRLESLVLALLEKDANDRPRRAKDILLEWKQLFDEVPLNKDQLARVDDLPVSLPSGTPHLYCARLVGREQQLNLLQGGVAGLAQGVPRPWLGLLEASAGLGKTRLIEAVVNYAKASGINVLNCPAFEASNLPYQLWLRALRWSSPEAASPELQPFRRALSALIPEAYIDLQLPKGDEAHPGNDPVQRYHLFEGMARLLSRQIRERKQCLIVLEDIHWADTASLEFLLYFIQTRWAEEGENLPLCLLFSWREEEAQASHELNALRRMLSELHGHHLRLDPLSEPETEQMLASMLGAPLEPSTVAKVHQETEGNPLFISELTRTLVSEGRLIPQSGQFVLDTSSMPRTSLGGSRIPGNMRDAILRRLDGLSQDSLTVLRLCAVLGSKVDFELLAGTTGLSERHLLDLVFLLVQRKLLVEKRDFYFPNQSTIDIVLETISIPELRALHRQIAQALESLFQRPATPGSGGISPDRVRQLAHFCQLSGDFPRAAQQLLVAAQQARQAYAYEDASQLLEQLLSLPESCYPEPAVQLQEMWADAVYCSGRTEDALAKYSLMLDNFGNRDSLGVGQSELESRIRLLRKIGTCLDRRGDLLPAHDRLREALGLLGIHLVQQGRNSKPVGFGRTLGILSRNFFSSLHSEGAWRARETFWVCERLVRVLYVIRPKSWIQDYLNLILIQFKVALTLRGTDRSGSSHPFAQALLLGGYFSLRGLKWTKLAQSSLIMAAQSAEEMSDSPQKTSLLRDTGYILLLSGAPSRARRLLENAFQVSRRIGDHHGIGRNHLQLASLYTYLGFLDKAQDEAAKGLVAADRTASHTDQTIAVSDLATTQAIRGLLTEARANLTVAEEMRSRCRATYIDLLFGRAHCYVAYFENQLETAQQLADHLFKNHFEGGELPFHIVNFGVISLAAQVQRFRQGGSFERQAFNDKVILLRKMAKGYAVYLKMLDRLEAQALFYQGKRSRALDQLAGCAYWAEREDHPLEAARTHLCLAQMLDEEGLGDHHRRQAAREFARAGVINVYH